MPDYEEIAKVTGIEPRPRSKSPLKFIYLEGRFLARAKSGQNRRPYL